MKKWIAFFLPLLSTFTVNAVEPELIEADKAVFYVNKTVMICGNVAQIKSFANRTYLNLGMAYPKQKIALLIWQDSLNDFTQKFGHLDELRNKRVCARGTVSEYKNKLQMILTNPDFLQQM